MPTSFRTHSPFSFLLILFAIISGVNLEAKILSSKNVMVSVEVTVPDSWKDATIKSVGNDFHVNVYLTEDDRKIAHDTSAFFAARNNFILKSPKNGRASKKLTAQEIEKGGQHILSPYSVIRDENPGGGYVYIIIEELPKITLRIVGGHVVVNNDDSNDNDEWDKKEDGPIFNKGLLSPTQKDANGGRVEYSEPKLKKFSFIADWAGKPGSLTVTGNITGKTSIKLWEDETKTKPFTLSSSGITKPVGESGAEISFWVEGIWPTGSYTSLKFEAVYTVADGRSSRGEIRFGVTSVDLLVDSLNYNDTEIPTRNPSVDKIEFSNKEKHLGKIITSTWGDKDLDDIADGVDGLGLRGGKLENFKLVPLVVKLREPIDPNSASIRLNYNPSVPQLGKGISAIETQGGGRIIYKVNKSGFRIWTVDTKDRTSGENLADGGQFIPNHILIKWTDIPSTSGVESREKILFIEYVDKQSFNLKYLKEDLVIEAEDPEGAKIGYIKIDELKTPLEGNISNDGVSLSVLPIEIVEVLSDQIEDSECNKLPTKFFKGEPNNPMLMACRSNYTAYLNVLVKFGKPAEGLAYVGARKVGETKIIDSIVCKVPPLKTKLKFRAFSNPLNLEMFEIVAGIDRNGNNKLESDEVTTYFDRTRLWDKETKHPVEDKNNIKDKIIIVNDRRYISALSDLALSSNLPGSEYSGDLLSVFSKGNLDIPNATINFDIPISSNEEGLSHPVGAKWDNGCNDTTFRVTYKDESPASKDFENSNAIEQIIHKTIKKNRGSLKVNLGRSEWFDFSEDIDLIQSENVLIPFTNQNIDPNELGLAFGKVTVKGKMRIGFVKESLDRVSVIDVEIKGSFDDMYDFSYWTAGSGDLARKAAMVQAGHATLSSNPHIGKVFFTRVEFNNKKAWDYEY